MVKIIISVLLFTTMSSIAQTSAKKSVPSDEYLQMIRKRSDKIVSALAIADSAKFYNVSDIIANQYLQLNEIDNNKKLTLDSLKATAGVNKTVFENETKNLNDYIGLQIDSLHKVFIHSLSKELSPEQIEKVKDGMTYGVLPITYKGYQEMLPGLTDAQKKAILGMLTEAREKAMDAGTSEEKHKWFGKYKGRINNYLSAQGYNMKKASEEWQARTREGKSH
jgi:Protein of unknown function (DUF3826)